MSTVMATTLELEVWAIVTRRGVIPLKKRGGEFPTPLVFFKREWAERYLETDDAMPGETIKQAIVTIRDSKKGMPLRFAD